jgi:hypothetical protein
MKHQVFSANSGHCKNRSYSSGANKQAEVSIMDSAYYDVGTWEGWAGQSEMTTNEGYFKTGTLAGFPSWESYDKNSKSYGTWVDLNNRFMVFRFSRITENTVGDA